MRRTVLCVPILATALGLSVARAAPIPQLTSLFDCDGPVTEVTLSNADPASYAQFLNRDLANQACSYQRPDDQAQNDELQQRSLISSMNVYQNRVNWQLQHSNRPSVTAALFPGAGVGDPFRASENWLSASRGRIDPISFIASKTGARLMGEIYSPNSCPETGCPGVVMVTGAVGQHRRLYLWASEGLAESGYQVLTFDIQAQGESENLDHNNDGSFCMTQGCMRDAIPPDAYFDPRFFFDQLRDALRFLFSTPSSPYGIANENSSNSNQFNPRWEELNRTQIALLGHSTGATAAINLGQDDQRVKAIVSWGATSAINDEFVLRAHAPTLYVDSDYSQTSQPFFMLPQPFTKENGYRQIVDLGIDAMQIALRASTNAEWTYLPGRPASRYGERVSFYYTLAWLDAYLKGSTDPTKKELALNRLKSSSFDGSADFSSIGSGLYKFDSTTGGYRNFPFRIEGMAVRDRLSYIYRSMYWLQGGGASCDDLRNC